jgi:hypothetical protein
MEASDSAVSAHLNLDNPQAVDWVDANRLAPATSDWSSIFCLTEAILRSPSTKVVEYPTNQNAGNGRRVFFRRQLLEEEQLGVPDGQSPSLYL